MGFCYKTATIWQVIGYVIFIIKILAPLLLIILGIVNFAQAVISHDEKQISKSGTSFLKKAIAGIVIFFIPTIISVIFNLITDFTRYKGDFEICFNCITSPNKKCDTRYKGEIIPVDDSVSNEGK